MGLRPQLQFLPVLLTILCDFCHGRAEESSEIESVIPRILHQSWMSDDVRVGIRRMSPGARDPNPLRPLLELQTMICMRSCACVGLA